MREISTYLENASTAVVKTLITNITAHKRVSVTHGILQCVAFIVVMPRTVIDHSSVGCLRVCK